MRGFERIHKSWAGVISRQEMDDDDDDADDDDDDATSGFLDSMRRRSRNCVSAHRTCIRKQATKFSGIHLRWIPST